ncbi:MAG: universal stress protein [Betaproteobacteria bacterium]
MYAHLLVPTDGSKLSDKAVVHAISLARALHAKVSFFYASPDYPMPAYSEGVIYEPISRKEYAQLARKEGDKVLERAMAKAKAVGLECKGVQSIAASPWEAILQAAKRSKCDCIVMASHGRRGLTAMLLGSETQKVLTHSKLPVLVVR